MVLEPHSSALLLLRIFIGLIFFFQGYDKVFRIKVSGVADTFRQDFSNHNIPPAIVSLAAFITSYIELIGGLLLCFGLFKYVVLNLLMIDLIIAAIGFSIMLPMWDMKHIFPRLVILMVLLLLPQDWDTLTLDNIYQFFRNN